jgi:replicative DNA helicase
MKTVSQLRAEIDAGKPPLLVDPKMETAIIGAVILDPHRIQHAKLLIRGDDFADADLGLAWETLIAIEEAGKPVGDPKVVLSEFRRAGLPDSVASPAFIGQVAGGNDAAIAHSAPYYASEVRRLSLLRRQQGLAYDLMLKVAQPKADPVVIAAWVDAKLDIAGRSTDAPVRPIAAAAGDVLDELAEHETRPQQRSLFTGLSSIDQEVGGFSGGELIILAARPGCGKTTLATQVAIHNANAGRTALFVSLEMSDKELASRQLCSIARVDSRLVRSGNLDRDDRQALRDAKRALDGLPLRVWAPHSATIVQIRAVAKLEAAAGELRLIVVDYLGLVEPEDRSRPRHEQVGRVSAGLKSLSKELKVPVIALCQLNREADGQPPRLSHLRESGNIEQDADAVLFLHPDEQHDDRVKLMVAKHRHSDVGSFDLSWLRSQTRFVCPEF